ncbi:MAG: prolyl oligopeptidase family serine peptidase [Acidimicrobiales bacterium]
MIHGGPTSHARQVLALAKQFWTSRGFAVVDVDHGGSTGYGRPFRQLLAGRWGIVDVEDAAAAARHLAEEGLADGDHLAIRGGSAGGFTTLAALCFGDTFAAGASHYGVADLSALAADTHKFESRYLDGLVGRWPEDRATYEARSPIHHTEGFAAPLIVLQGSEDEVVPPNQAEMIVAALAAKGIPHAYVLFEGEQHGFRRAESIVRALEAELWFYGRVFGFEPADPIEPVAGAVGL